MSDQANQSPESAPESNQSSVLEGSYESRLEALQSEYAVSADVTERVVEPPTQSPAVAIAAVTPTEGDEADILGGPRVVHPGDLDAFSSMKAQFEAERQAFLQEKAAVEALKSEVERNRELNSLTLNDLYADIDKTANMPREQLEAITKALLYKLDPERAPKDYALTMQERALAKREADVQRQAAEQRARIEEELKKFEEENARAKITTEHSRQVQAYTAHVTQVLAQPTFADEHPYMSAYYNGDTKLQQDAILRAAQFLSADEKADLSPQAAAKYVEAVAKQEAEKYARAATRKVGSTPQRTTPGRAPAASVSELSFDDQVRALKAEMGESLE